MNSPQIWFPHRDYTECHKITIKISLLLLTASIRNLTQKSEESVLLMIVEERERLSQIITAAIVNKTSSSD